MWRRLTYCVLFILASLACFSQYNFQKILNGVGGIYSVYETPSKEYLITGYLNYTYEGYLIKLDSSFNVVWSRYFPNHKAIYVTKINNGSYFGVVNDYGSNHFFKFDEAGNITIIRSYSVNGTFGNIVQSGTNRLVVGGNIMPGVNRNDWFVTSVDTNANIYWSNHYGGWSADDGGHVLALPNGEIVVTGEPESGNMANAGSNFGLIKLDTAGNYIWGKDFGSVSEGDYGQMSKLTSDGNITYLGYSTMPKICPVIGKFDLMGNLIWIKKYPFKNNTLASSFDEDSNGNIILAGGAIDTSFGSSVLVQKLFSFSVDKTGAPLWAKSYGASLFPYDFSQLGCAKINSNGKLILTGSKTIDLSTNTNAGVLIKADLNGSTNCEEKNLTFSVLNPNYFYDIFDSLLPVSVSIISPITYSAFSNPSFSVSCISVPLSAAINNAVVCSGDCATLLSTTVGGVPPLTYSWNPNIGNGSGPYKVCPATTSHYSLTIKDQVGQIFTAVSTVSVTNFNGTININPTNGYAPLTINLTNQFTGATNYLLNLGDTTVNNFIPQYTYQTPETYPVTCIASDSTGCSDTLRFIIIVYPPCESDKKNPNVFTPDSDGINDTFKINVCQLQTFTCNIYNRWGYLINEMNQINNSWDGRTTSGDSCSEGVYFYILETKDSQNKIKQTKGFIQLLR